MNPGKLLVASTWLILATPAYAHWNYAPWGMNVTELVAASGGQAHAVKDDKGKRILDQRRLAAARTKEDGIAYEVSFYFDPNKKLLTKVGLFPTETDCDAAVAKHIERLGTHEFEDKVIVLMTDRPPMHEKHYRWNDLAGSGTIELIDISVAEMGIRHCQILYEA